jgi:hypothetical protein
MQPLKDTDISARREAAEKAKQKMLERFRAKQDDPAAAERKAERLAIAQAREQRQREREERKKAEAERLAAEQKAREDEAARLAAEEAEREAIRKREEGDRAIALLQEQKAARDARYAARKARKR